MFMDDLESRKDTIERNLAIAERRGDATAIERLMAELRELDPQSLAVIKADVQVLIKSKKGDEALKMLSEACAARPDDKELASLFADVVYKQKIDGVTVDMDAPASAFEESTTARASAMTSMFLPGLGQILAGDVPKGYFMTGGYLGGWITVFLIPNGIAGFMKLLGLSRDPGIQFNGLILLPMGMIVAIYLWSISDASIAAKPYKKTIVEHPKPPVDKDFEI